MNLKKIYAPRKEFVEHSKNVFLSAFDQKFRGERRPHSAFRYFLQGLASGVAIMIIVSGGAVYADERNVGPESILYPLKRSKEAVDLALTSDLGKPSLHLKFAERRLEEIKTFESDAPENPKILTLKSDFEGELRESLAALNGEPARTVAFATSSVSADPEAVSTSSPRTIRLKSGKREDEREEKRGNDKRKAVCESFQGILRSEIEGIESILKENPSFILKFEKKCLPVIRENDDSLERQIIELKEKIKSPEIKEKDTSDDNRGKQKDETQKVEQKREGKEFPKNDE
ncbi:MAG: hypothetical protein HY435_01355 [Candidatus Liptonbacteria bacterium]|nr:hypothetical protein [Candidatus Liptonbacteria bacterium]